MTALPTGFGLELDRSVRTFDGGRVLVGGRPGRMLRLTADGVRSLSDLLAGRGVVAPATAELAGRLVAAGLAHPLRPPSPSPAPGASRGPGAVRERVPVPVPVAVPVRDRPGLLDRCLTALGPTQPVVVVDDGSLAPGAVAEVCRRHGATLVVRPTNGGPGAARNDALARTSSDLVAFVDSDCQPSAGWLDGLTWHFADPSVGAVAPRVVPAPVAPGGHRDRGRRRPGRSVLERFAAAHSPLDLGPDRGEVGPDRAVRYVPATALVVRRRALGDGFDPDLRVGEDVDLVWRLIRDGWRVRYEPSVTVHHLEPVTWAAWCGRRFRYGTSAGPLDVRHRGLLSPLELRPLPAVAVVAVVAGHPTVAAVAAVAGWAWLARAVAGAGLPRSLPVRWDAAAVAGTAVGLGRSVSLLAAPAVAVVGAGAVALPAGARQRRRAAPGGHRRRAAGRLAVAGTALALVPPLVDWWRSRPALDPVRWSLASLLDDAAYGVGVWTGCVRARTPGPLLPTLRLRRARTDS